MATCSDGKEREYVVFNIDRGVRVAERVRLAGNSAARRKGLLQTDGLPEGAGLWIAPCEAIHTFGMQMPIDAIFIDGKLRVRKLRAHLKPYRVCICLSADSVLELAAGTVAQTRTVAGDRLRFEEVHGSRGGSGVWPMS